MKYLVAFLLCYFLIYTASSALQLWRHNRQCRNFVKSITERELYLKSHMERISGVTDMATGKAGD